MSTLIIKDKIIKAIKNNNFVLLEDIIKKNPKINLNFIFDYVEKDTEDGSYINWRATPVIYVSIKGYDKCLNILLKAGANHNITVSFSNKIDYFYQKALVEACYYGHTECVRLLLQYKANPNMKHYDRGYSVLTKSVIHDNVDCTELLLKAGAKVDAKTGYKNDTTALLDACIYNSINCIKLLLKWKADVNTKDFYNQTPLIEAIAYDRQDEYLKLSCVKILLESGANPDIQSRLISYYHTALFAASNKGYINIIKELFKYKANPFLKNTYMENALDVAKNKETKQLLKDYMTKYSVYLFLKYKNKKIRIPDELLIELTKYIK